MRLSTALVFQRVDRNIIADMLAEGVAIELVGVDKEIDADIAINDGKTVHHREAGDIDREYSTAS